MTTVGQSGKLAASFESTETASHTIRIQIDRSKPAETRSLRSILQGQERRDARSDPIVWILLGTNVHVEHEVCTVARGRQGPFAAEHPVCRAWIVARRCLAIWQWHEV